MICHTAILKTRQKVQCCSSSSVPSLPCQFHICSQHLLFSKFPLSFSFVAGGSVGGDPSSAQVGSSVLGVSPATQKLWDSPSASGGGVTEVGGGGGGSGVSGGVGGGGGEGKSPASASSSSAAAPLFLGTNQWGPSAVSRSNDDATWGPQPPQQQQPSLNTNTGSVVAQGQRGGTDHSVSQHIPLMGGRSTHHTGQSFCNIERVIDRNI